MRKTHPATYLLLIFIFLLILYTGGYAIFGTSFSQEHRAISVVIFLVLFILPVFILGFTAQKFWIIVIPLLVYFIATLFKELFWSERNAFLNSLAHDIGVTGFFEQLIIYWIFLTLSFTAGFGIHRIRFS